MKAAHKISNRSAAWTKSNAKNNAKVQEQARVENEKRIAKMSKNEAIISKDAAYLLVTNMIEREPQFRLGRWCLLADILGVCVRGHALLLLRLLGP